MSEIDQQAGHAGARLRDHEFDGIREFDNRLPNWWLWSFYLACIFSVFYWIHYHVLGTGKLPREQFRLDMAAAAAAKVVDVVTKEALIELSKDQAAVQAGKEIFEINCVSCHAKNAGGVSPEKVELLGPNLTDKYWIHGGSPEQIHHTVTKGVVEKGMLPWESIIGSAKCQQVTGYVLTLRNTNVEGGKPPEGEPYEDQ